MKTPFLVAGIVAAFLTSCVLKSPPPRNSRYHADITQMQKVSWKRDTWEWKHPTKKTTDYTEFIVEPTKVYVDVPKISEDDRYVFNEFSAASMGATRRILGKEYFLTSTPGKSVMRIEVEILDIKKIVKLQKDGIETTKFGSSTVGSKLEANCYDAMTGELLYALSTLYEGDEYAAYSDTSLLENVQKAYDEWLPFFKKRFDSVMKF